MPPIEIPFEKLGIPESIRKSVDPGTAKPMRLATAKGMAPVGLDAQLVLLCILSVDPDADVRAAALETTRALPNVAALLSQKTSPTVLDFLSRVRPERDLDERILTIRNTADETACRIAERADGRMCEMIAENNERLLLTPEIARALHANRACTDATLERAVGFLRMQHSLPSLPPQRPWNTPGANTPGADAPKPAQAAPQAAPQEVEFDLEAEIEAALSGKPSPMLEQRQKLEMFDLDRLDGPKVEGPLAGFSLSFKDPDAFAWDLMGDDDDMSDEQKLRLEQRIGLMSIGQKIKLAYLGNKEVRSILIRDRNKQVAVAVVKSGRLTDAEVLAYAGNRNLPDDIFREIGSNREWMRKYPVKVALVSNPKCPPSIAVTMIPHLQGKDLSNLANNRNVSSVVFQMAQRLMRDRKKDDK